MITLQENYLDLTIDEVYDIINEFDKVPWPNNFTMDKKIKFLIKDIKKVERILFCSVVPKSFNLVILLCICSAVGMPFLANVDWSKPARILSYSL